MKLFLSNTDNEFAKFVILESFYRIIRNNRENNYGRELAGYVAGKIGTSEIDSFELIPYVYSCVMAMEREAYPILIESLKNRGTKKVSWLVEFLRGTTDLRKFRIPKDANEIQYSEYVLDFETWWEINQDSLIWDKDIAKLVWK